MNILVTSARAPIAADIAKSLSTAGHRVWMTDSWRRPIGAASPFSQGLLHLPAPRENFRGFCERLKEICLELDVEAIVPTSEEVFWLAGAAPILPSKVSLRTSELSTLANVHHKGAFARLAWELGYGVEENHEITDVSGLKIIEAAPSRYVVKPIYSRFATKALVGPTLAQLARVRPSASVPWLAQTRVHGRELCSYNVAERGRLLLHVGYEPKARYGLGASVYFQPVASSALQAMSERFIRTTEFTGQISFDAIETNTGIVALECNPRGTSGVHLAVQEPENLAAALLGNTSEETPSSSREYEPRMLLAPWLLANPGFLLRREGRAIFRSGKDALAQAGIGAFQQARAALAISWRAARRGEGVAATSTADIEWNGEKMEADVARH